MVIVALTKSVASMAATGTVSTNRISVTQNNAHQGASVTGRVCCSAHLHANVPKREIVSIVHHRVRPPASMDMSLILWDVQHASAKYPQQSGLHQAPYRRAGYTRLHIVERATPGSIS
ncbi:hypothetical protein RRG08_048101 [Elysia crispata]|uniref:Uncharacterized protein n=1 Tax=Elysia crispata TaxID=231223 RepID=A0AAE0Z1I8_9GAST|nr:hypothetical protein RRG08_048101 [Elysia crispata]